MRRTKKITADFHVLEDEGAVNILECPRCGYEFKVDAHTSENLRYNRDTQWMVAVCPLCDTEQK